MKYTPKIRGRHVRLGNIGMSARPMAAFSGFYEIHKPSPLGDMRGIVPVHRHRHRHQNGQQKGVFWIIVLLIVALAAAGAIRSE